MSAHEHQKVGIDCIVCISKLVAEDLSLSSSNLCCCVTFPKL